MPNRHLAVHRHAAPPGRDRPVEIRGRDPQFLVLGEAAGRFPHHSKGLGQNLLQTPFELGVQDLRQAVEFFVGRLFCVEVRLAHGVRVPLERNHPLPHLAGALLEACPQGRRPLPKLLVGEGQERFPGS